MAFDVGGSPQSTWRKCIVKLGEHANSTQKVLSWVQNQDLHAARQHIACVNTKKLERYKGYQFY